MQQAPQLTTFNRRFTGFIADHPWWSLALALALVAGLCAGAPRLRADFTHRGFFYADDPYLLEFDAFERRFGNDDAVVVAMHSPSGIFDTDSARLLTELTERMWKIPDVIRVDSLSNFNWVHARDDDIVVEPLLPEAFDAGVLAARRKIALEHPVLPGYLVSRDATTALVFARIVPGFDKPPRAEIIVPEVEQLVAGLRRGDHSFHISGGPPLTAAFKRVAEHDMKRLLPAALGTAMLFLFLVLRSLAGVVLPVLVLCLTIAATFGFAGWADLELTTMSTAVPSILIAACVADSVHILVHYYEARKRGLGRHAAALESLSLNLLPTFLTSFTTALGLASFATAQLKPVAGLGYMAGMGAMIAWVLTYLFLGATLFLLPLRVGRVPAEVHERDARWAARYTAWLARHRPRLLVVAAVASAAAAVLAARIEVNSDPFKYFSRAVPIRSANEFVEAQVGGARGVELVVESGREEGIKDPGFLRKVEALQHWAEQQKGITRTVSILDVLKSMHRSLNGDDPAFYRIADDREAIAQELLLYSMSLPVGMDLNDRMTVKQDALRITVLSTIPTSREAVAMVEAMVAKAASLGLTVKPTGKYFLYQRTQDYVVQAFVGSFGLAFALIAVVMTVFLRSLRLGLLAMIPNVVPVIFGGALLVVLGQPLDLGTVIVASVSLGIAVDDTIHVLANYNRLRRAGLSGLEALQGTLAHAGRALVFTTAILVLSFGGFVLADFTPNLWFGLLTAFVLGLALVTDVIVTCAVLAVGPRVTGLESPARL